MGGVACRAARGTTRGGGRGGRGGPRAPVRRCDREGCSNIGDRPAPKAPHSKERWYFCEAHAAEYNRNWNYCAELSPEEAARRAAEEETEKKGFRQSAPRTGAGPGDASRSRPGTTALGTFGV